MIDLAKSSTLFVTHDMPPFSQCRQAYPKLLDGHLEAVRYENVILVSVAILAEKRNARLRVLSLKACKQLSSTAAAIRSCANSPLTF